MENKKHIKFRRSPWIVLIEIIVAVGVCYFLLGGSEWSPATWAVFTILAAWIIIMNVRLEAGLESEKSYLKWKQLFGLVVVVALLISPLWTGSYWTFIVGLILGLLWLDDYRHMKDIFKNDSETSQNDLINGVK